ncbi:hypothetical protein BGX38DRAFT_1328698 [Terfezia claveryi]|nr:hypothetical protein BGX38DRAFT_1328698 [Terfezia claveryi]
MVNGNYEYSMDEEEEPYDDENSTKIAWDRFRGRNGALDFEDFRGFEGFGLSAGLTRFATEKPTQPEATVIGSSTLIDQLLPIQLHPPLIQIPNAQVENITRNSVATPQARYLLDHEKGIRGEIREAVQKEINSQDDRLVKTIAVRQETFATLPCKAWKVEGNFQSNPRAPLISPTSIRSFRAATKRSTSATSWMLPTNMKASQKTAMA